MEFGSKEKIHYSSMACHIHFHTLGFGFFDFLMVSLSQGYYSYILDHISKAIASMEVIVSFT